MQSESTNLWLAVDQYGQKEIVKGSPRKALMELHGTKHADRMFVDKQNGGTLSTGWVIAGHWYTVFRLSRMEHAV